MLASLSWNSGHMASHPTDAAHRPLRFVQSFRVERSVSPGTTARVKGASPVQNGPVAVADPMLRTASGTQGDRRTGTEVPDTFERRISEETVEPPRASVDLDDLPIELISLTDRFIDSLSAKVHPQPPSIDNLARLFQDFYATASSHIQTHVDSMATLQRREEPSASLLSSQASASSLLRTKGSSLGTREKPRPTPSRRDSDQQLLTAEEYAERKRARKALEHKKGLLEEAVERRICEGIYSKIYRHRSTQDEAQDAKLRSKTAALAVVGIGPGDLGVDLGTAPNDPEAAAKKQEEVRQWLEQARKELVLMSQSRYPLGKLNHLKAAHKSIIDTLSHFHPSSSADELMPMLIYTLITLPPENLSVISDANFIQRFRWEPKLVGEGSYCLTNLEATISFLETVDLSTLRADETPTGPLKGQDVSPTQKEGTFPPAFSPTPPSPATLSPNHSESAAASLGAALKQAPSSARFRATVGAQLRGPRRLSDLVNTPAQAFNAASDAVLNTADQSLKTIGTSLGDSYKFLLGKLRERAPDALLAKDSSGDPVVIVPKTLDDARKLIGTPSPAVGQLESLQEEGGAAVPLSASPGSSLPLLRSPSPAPATAAVEEAERPPLLSFIAGSARKVSRDHSADSSRSASSRKEKEERQRLDTTVAPGSATAATATATGSSPVITSPPIMDSMRNLGNSLNPMARLSAGIGGLRGFGRSPAPVRAPTPPAKDGGHSKGGPAAADGGDLTTAFPDLAAVLPPRESPKLDPPIKRFMEMQNAAEMKLGEVFELLRDYKRLAGALKEMGSFKE